MEVTTHKGNGSSDRVPRDVRAIFPRGCELWGRYRCEEGVGDGVWGRGEGGRGERDEVVLGSA